MDFKSEYFVARWRGISSLHRIYNCRYPTHFFYDENSQWEIRCLGSFDSYCDPNIFRSFMFESPEWFLEDSPNLFPFSFLSLKKLLLIGVFTCTTKGFWASERSHSSCLSHWVQHSQINFQSMIKEFGALITAWVSEICLTPGNFFRELCRDILQLLEFAFGGRLYRSLMIVKIWVIAHRFQCQLLYWSWNHLYTT